MYKDAGQWSYEKKNSQHPRKSTWSLISCGHVMETIEEKIPRGLAKYHSPAYASYLESKIILHYQFFAWYNPYMKNTQQFLQTIKKYVEFKFYRKFEATLLTLVRFKGFIDHCSWGLDLDMHECFDCGETYFDQGFLFYVMWKDIGRLIRKEIGKPTFNNILYSFQYHQSLWATLEYQFVDEYFNLCHMCNHIRQTDAPIDTLFFKNRMITNACKLFVRRMSRHAQKLQDEDVCNPRFGMLTIDEITWDIQFPFLHLIQK